MLHEIFLPGHWPLGSLMMSQYGPGAKISHSTDSSATTTILLGGCDIRCSFFVCCQNFK